MQLELSDLEQLLSRIQEMESKVAALEARIIAMESVGFTKERTEKLFPAEKISVKYRPLAKYLFESGERRVQLDYTKIEEILGFPLPATAYNYPQSYWANTGTHSYSSGWMEVGYKARVDIEKKIVTFEETIA